MSALDLVVAAVVWLVSGGLGGALGYLLADMKFGRRIEEEEQP